MTRHEMRAQWPKHRVTAHDHTWKEPWPQELRFCTLCGLMEFWNVDVYHASVGWKRCERSSLRSQIAAGMRIERVNVLGTFDLFYLV